MSLQEVTPSKRTPADREIAALTLIHGLLLAGSIAILVRLAYDPAPIAGFGFRLDRLAALMTFLVASVAWTTFRFSVRYLNGESGHLRFLRWHTCTVISVFGFMLASNLLLLFATWSATSLGLHKLLTHYGTRSEALPPARKKFLISRLGDVLLIAAIGMIFGGWRTLDLNQFLAAAQAAQQDTAVTIIAILVALAALTKSAQFPFHSWLPETMEAPTPVSALMHAGIINAGGALLLRFAPLLACTPQACGLLVLVGTLTMGIGVLAMWAQVKVKRTLAWSTVSQMGFMMIQCGLLAFPAAVIHILGHGWYKAWKFLQSGELSKPVPQRTLSLSVAGAIGLLGTFAAIPALLLAARWTGFDPLHSAGETALAAILALAIGQIWVSLARATTSVSRSIPWILAATLVVPFAAFALYASTATFLEPVLPRLPHQNQPSHWLFAAIPVSVLVAIVALHTCLPRLARSEYGQALYIHALNGFYWGAWADRVVRRLWPVQFPPNPETSRASLHSN